VAPKSLEALRAQSRAVPKAGGAPGRGGLPALRWGDAAGRRRCHSTNLPHAR
jgi:hypothetical protein